jgi:hypothetical protein
VPYGTDSRLNLFQAINCLATISRSLRDGFFSTEFQAMNCLAIFIRSLRDKVTAPFRFLTLARGLAILLKSRTPGWKREWHGGPLVARHPLPTLHANESRKDTSDRLPSIRGSHPVVSPSRCRAHRRIRGIRSSSEHRPYGDRYRQDQFGSNHLDKTQSVDYGNSSATLPQEHLSARLEHSMRDHVDNAPAPDGFPTVRRYSVEGQKKPMSR